jgi:hypothetical protein
MKNLNRRRWRLSAKNSSNPLMDIIGLRQMELPKFLLSGDCGPVGDHEIIPLSAQKLDPNDGWDFFWPPKALTITDNCSAASSFFPIVQHTKHVRKFKRVNIFGVNV